MSGLLTVLSGPSGVGKDAVIGEIARRNLGIWVSVSATTRPPRPGECDGRPYRFLDRAEFLHCVNAGEFLEYAEYAGNLYGTPRRPVEEKLAAGISVLLKIELSGARQVRRAMPQARLVFLAPPSWTELERRLIGRGTEAPELLAQRLEQARVEISAGDEFDAVVVNDNVEHAADELIRLLRVWNNGIEGDH